MILVSSFGGRVAHRRMAVSPTASATGIESRKDNPMLKTHKIALDPNNVQATQFAQHCGYARVAYNHVLADFKGGLDNDGWRSHIELNKRFNAIKRDTYEWCSQLNQRAAHNAIYFNFQDAIKRRKSGQSLFPKLSLIHISEPTRPY